MKRALFKRITIRIKCILWRICNGLSPEKRLVSTSILCLLFTIASINTAIHSVCFIQQQGKYKHYPEVEHIRALKLQDSANTTYYKGKEYEQREFNK